jgi:hypothetical protein
VAGRDHLVVTCIQAWEQETDWLPGKFIAGSNKLLLQTDFWNCGLFCTLLVMDFMMTQWRNSYAVSKVVQHRTDIEEEKIVWIPETYGLVTTFALVEQERGDGIEVCFLVRLEMKCLWKDLMPCISLHTQKKTTY